MAKQSDSEVYFNSLTFHILYTANFHKSFRRNFHAQFVSPDFSADETSIIYFLTVNPKISQVELAKTLFKGKAHVGKILNEMIEKGLIKREGKFYHILPKGYELHKKSSLAFKQVKKKMNMTFTPEEREQFLNFLSRYRALLESIVDVKLK